ncbi:MAG: protein TolR [Rhodospirillaceae bacterium]|nr:protein TolR [Rhodospirillaceae bacterium]|tara:strand:+ start:463 stop:888 length:426 start_codon:yes stop_codon:yes gene_type:complete
MTAFLAEKKQQKSTSYKPMSEINVTPFVDVMLVLLVIFMVTAPLLTVGVSVDLPKTKAKAIPGKDEPLAITIDSSGKIFIQDTEVELNTLTARLKAISNNRQDSRIFIRGDKNIDYGKVMEVMSEITAAGFNKVSLITEKP